MTAFDSATGKQIWKSYTIPQEPKVIKRNSVGVDYMGPSGAGVWTTPIVDTKRRAIYFGTGNSFSEPATYSDSMMAMSMDTGKILWWKQAMANDVWHGGCVQTVPGRASNPAGRPGRGNQPPYPADNCVEKTGPDWDYAASPNLATLPDGRTVIIASPKQAVVRALDPDRNGATIWEQDIARGIGGGAGETVFGGAIDSDTIYFGLHLGNGLVALGSRYGRREMVQAASKARSNGHASRNRRRCQRDTRRVLCRRNGRNNPRRVSQRWKSDLGVQYRSGIQNREWSRREGRFYRRRRANPRERNAVCWLGLCRIPKRRAWKRLACFRSLKADRRG